MDLELGYYPIGQNYGFYIDKAPQNVLDELKLQIDNLQFDFNKGIKANKILAGEIKHEYIIEPQLQTKHYIKNLSQEFENVSQYISLNHDSLPNLKFADLWVNFQKKYEYNPIHRHNGVFSFVIWYKIPYTFENEAKYHYGSDDGNKCMHGKFAFVVPENFNKRSHVREHPLPLDKSNQSYVAIFPSNLSHMVYPFYSTDEYRITVAGNIIESK